MSLSRVVLVTNITRFIGLASALAIASSQPSTTRILVHDVHLNADTTARKTFIEKYPNLIVCSTTDCGHGAVDVAEKLGDEVLKEHGRVDVLVNNDAFPATRLPVDMSSAKDMRDALDELVVAPYTLTGKIVRGMKERKSGKIVFVTSAAPLRGLANYSPYTTGRGAANSLVKSLAQELAPFGINVNAVAPNYIESPIYFPPALLEDEAKKAKIIKNVPLGRLGKPEEAGAAVAYLASDAASFHSGVVLPLAGGWA